MRIGVISDIHGNALALDRVLEAMPPVDGMVCAGDVVGYGPWPSECVDTVRDQSIPTVCGNHDRAVRANTAFRFSDLAAAGVSYAREQCTAADIEWLDTLPDERTLFDDRVRVVHGHPDDPDRYTYPGEFAPDLLADEPVLIMGHTHVQGHATFDEGIVMNPGSVGQPRDRDPRAAYAVLDLAAMDVEEYRVEYDVSAVQSAVAAAGLPREIGRRLEAGR